MVTDTEADTSLERKRLRASPQVERTEYDEDGELFTAEDTQDGPIGIVHHFPERAEAEDL